MPDCPAELSLSFICQLYPITSDGQPDHRRAVRTLGRVPKTFLNKLFLIQNGAIPPAGPQGPPFDKHLLFLSLI